MRESAGARLLRECEIAILDYETTGSVPGWTNEPWQIGMVVLRGGRVDPDSRFESLLRVDPGRPFSPHAPGNPARRRAELATAPTPEALWPEARRRLTGRPLGAHNAATERKFLRLMAPMHRFGPWIDTLRLARKAWPDAPTHALEDLTGLLGLLPRVEALCPGREAHDALFDAVACAVLLERLMEDPAWKSLRLEEVASEASAR